MATLRFLVMAEASALGESYCAQFYDLARLHGYPGVVMEIGRFCVAPECHDAEVVRVALGALGRVVDRACVGLIVGCSSFAGTDPAPYRDAFALLHARHLAPPRWRPGVKARLTIGLLDGGDAASQAVGNPRNALPPLLRSYLAMGGWVSDHAVVDCDLDTLHVFTAVEVSTIPRGRARVLRAMGH